MKTRGNGLKANTPRPAPAKFIKVEKDSPEHNCKHGVDVYNCYDGCYDEMKNGTVS
jgi:hypothetical protein